MKNLTSIINMRKSKASTHVDPSRNNVLSLDSSIATPQKPLSKEPNQHIVSEIINHIFDEQKGVCDVSSSQCSSLQLHSSDYSYDKRLKYWKDVLKDREKLNLKIKDKTAKRSNDILYNNLSTIDERDKQTIKRILDYAQRLNPIHLMAKKTTVLEEKYNPKTCRAIPEIQETLPKAEREGKACVEISGLPKVTKQELLGKDKNQGCKKSHNWLKSKHLDAQIDEKREDIERVVEFYPDIENLQIVGEGIFKKEVLEHNSQIELLLPVVDICEISSESIEFKKQQPVPENPQQLPKVAPEYALKINEHTFYLANNHEKRYKKLEIETSFHSRPFCSEIKRIMAIENIGQKVLNFQWSNRSYYKRNSNLLKSLDNEFILDNSSFRLCGGDSKDFSVLYQPRRVAVVKSKWVLKVKPNFFERRVDGIAILLIGKCEPTEKYVKKLQDIQSEVVEKSNMKMMRKLALNLGTITANLEPIEISCPYQRTLNELELFEKLNAGFKCERFHDLELLKDLYKRVKKPRDKIWDLQVDTLKSSILRISNAEYRALYFNELSVLLDGMKGQGKQLQECCLNNSEKDKTRLFYVRGIVSTSIDEWQDLTGNLEVSFMKTLLHTTQYEDDDTQTAEKEQNNNKTGRISESHSFQKSIRSLKSFQDSWYMQTYTLVCNAVENIVNVIESTEVF
ncbi:uncharacterized protein LOC106088894 isoform X1 [Stomoxys calcitrans]|uniref:uncharacterized protein LOC106088894 isoform X1 n=1 Tax=Stomoxys calcitrans TaxID=35570 RepID=UPI0027E27466|nr:uncharacterized protein LOC106088894 isoform X1 [Stomoxys calcitrans]